MIIPTYMADNNLMWITKHFDYKSHQQNNYLEVGQDIKYMLLELNDNVIDSHNEPGPEQDRVL